jgi:hypothetical protein
VNDDDIPSAETFELLRDIQKFVGMVDAATTFLTNKGHSRMLVAVLLRTHVQLLDEGDRWSPLDRVLVSVDEKTKSARRAEIKKRAGINSVNALKKAISKAKNKTPPQTYKDEPIEMVMRCVDELRLLRDLGLVEMSSPNVSVTDEK